MPSASALRSSSVLSALATNLFLVLFLVMQSAAQVPPSADTYVSSSLPR